VQWHGQAQRSSRRRVVEWGRKKTENVREGMEEEWRRDGDGVGIQVHLRCALSERRSGGQVARAAWQQSATLRARALLYMNY
jgi:hypothetical protein